MTNAESLAWVVTALGGTPSGTTNADLLAEIVTALGGEPVQGSSNDDLIGQIAAAYASATVNLVAENIKSGVTILGVTGTYEGGGK